MRLAVALACSLSSLAFGLYPPPGDDAALYLRLAESLRNGEGYAAWGVPSAARVPGYPLFLALVGPFYGVAQALIYGASMGALAGAALTVWPPRIVGVAFALLACNPYVSRWSGAALTESLYTSLLALCVAALVYARELPWLYPVVGVLWMGATMLRPLTLLLLPGLLLCVYLQSRRPWRDAAALALVGLLLWAPWVARNYAVFSRFIPLQSKSLGVSLWMTTLPAEDLPRGDWSALSRWPAKYPEIRRLSEARGSAEEMDSDRAVLRVGLERIAGDPLRWARGRLAAIPRLWLHSGHLIGVPFSTAWKEGRYATLAAKAGVALSLSIVPLGLALAGLRLASRSWLPFLIVPATLLLAHLPLWVEDRYGMPAWPYLYLFAASALHDRHGSR